MKKKPTPVRRYDGDLSFVSKFLLRLVDNTPSSPDPRETLTGHTWIRQDEGMLTLDSNEYRDYQEVRTELAKKLAPEEDLSKATIDSALQDAIFATLDIRNRSNEDTNNRVKEAVQSLRGLTDRPSEAFKCWSEVRGLDLNSLPTSFGHIRFVKFTDCELNNLLARLKPNNSALLASLSKRLMGTGLGIVERKARDIRAAIVLASREEQITVECLNFFSDMLDYNHSWLSLPGGHETAVTTKIAVGRGGAFVTDSRVGPVGGYDIARLRSQPNIQAVVQRVDQLLQERESEVDELLLKALRWAGRATVAPSRGEAFMLYAIALECVVLPGADRGELRHRLSQRIAKVTQDSVAKRAELQKTMSRLYDVRSKIVHSGHYKVQEDELYLIRNITKGVILRLLTDVGIAKLEKASDLDRWYEERMLEG